MEILKRPVLGSLTLNKDLPRESGSRVVDCNNSGSRRWLLMVTCLVNLGLTNALSNKQVGERVVTAGGVIMCTSGGLALLSPFLMYLMTTLYIKYCLSKNPEEDIQLIERNKTNNPTNTNSTEAENNIADKAMKITTIIVITSLISMMLGLFIFLGGLITRDS